jgi:hypothetical protein
MDPLKKAWIILIGILAAEAVPFVFVLRLSPPGVLARLYGFDAAHWPAWAAALLVALAYILYAMRAFPLIRTELATVSALKVAAIAMAIVSGTVEELYFRKILMDWAGHHGWAALGQVALSAIAFGAAHAVWGLFGKQWRVAVGAAIATGVLGALLGGVYLLSGRQVAPCIWSHMLINLTIEPWLILAAVTAAYRTRTASPAARTAA